MAYRVRTNTGCDHFNTEPCERCEVEMRRAPASPRVHVFYEGWYPHLDLEPVYISSPQQLRDEAKSRGLTSLYLEESSTWRRREPSRWW
jgi:hypothetical protein